MRGYTWVKPKQHRQTPPRDRWPVNGYHAFLVKHHRILLSAGSFLALLATGCSSPGPAKPQAATAPVAAPAAPGPSLGEIIHVNRELGYVVVNCTALPSNGEELRVFRGEQPVGLVRVTGPVRDVFAGADIVEGEARQGDRLRH
jgi:hypothetical protein